jgi:hypothetical protein
MEVLHAMWNCGEYFADKRAPTKEAPNTSDVEFVFSRVSAPRQQRPNDEVH